MIPVTHWLLYTIFSLFLYGFWGLFSKLSTNYIDPKRALVYEVGGAILVSLLLIWRNDFKWQGDIRGILYAVLVGTSGTLATLCFFVAISQASATIVIPLTSLYPVITILLAFLILKEPITLRQGIGILLAIIALLLCLWE
ncbi:MAG: EamA family transporter [Aulosira sp. ZfuVER01]|nr:EamA family transporter [Aulosira sp. ZfuVER01]MDZ7999482.1 EamA family transporter [Aulosira sp. DedVER01a]MDZ8054738.1 EamA family transporter [Aulosira sp. ZfuCHP01]